MKNQALNVSHYILDKIMGVLEAKPTNLSLGPSKLSFFTGLKDRLRSLWTPPQTPEIIKGYEVSQLIRSRTYMGISELAGPLIEIQ